MTNQPRIAVYGATGFTGKLVVRELARSANAMIIAGRTQSKLDALSREIRVSAEVALQTRQASVDDAASLDAMLDGVDVLINCAGPFGDLGLAVVAAAVRNGVHYFDTTGEQSFMRQVQQEFDVRARAGGVVLAPATAYEFAVGGFAARLAVKAGAHRLGVCYAQRNSGMSHGTKKSVLRALANPGYTFVGGKLVKTKMAYRIFDVPRPGRPDVHAVWIPGGESLQVPLFAKHISQVETCLAVGARTSKLLKRGLGLMSPAFGLARPLLDRLIDRSSGDPHEDAVSTGEQRPDFLVTAFDPDEAQYFVGIAGGDPYLTTARIIAEAARRTLANPPEEGGFTSAAALFEPRDFLDAVGLEVVEI